MSRIPFGPDAIHLLVDLLEQRQLAEIELADGESRIRIVRAVPGFVASTAQVTMAANATATAVNSASAGVLAAADDSISAADAPGLVRSQMVGIAYLSPEPDAPPFVTPGQRVAPGETLLLLEAMKTFSKIVAPVGGVVTRIHVDSGDLVDFGMPLVLLE